MIKYLGKVGKEKLGDVAIVRLDFNTDDTWRMETAIPTLKFLLKKKCKILVLSHRGRPKDIRIVDGKPQGSDLKLSLRRDAIRLASLIKEKVGFISHFRFPEIKELLDRSRPRSIFVLENIRFLKEEYENSPALGKKLAGLGDFYVNEGFPISHRKDASVSAIAEFLPAYAGFQLEREITHLSRVTLNPKKPLVIVLGGGKAGDKLGLLKFFADKADKFLIGGEPANTLLWIKGVDIGDSIAEKDNRENFLPLLNYKNLVLPGDYHIQDKQILDIGPETEKLFAETIKRAGTVIWNGPMGFFERKVFAGGSVAVAKAIAQNKQCFSLAGGGETVMFLRRFGFFNKFSFVSTGGGAMLEFLAGEKLPGIKALEDSLIKP